jgi:hypothetical protein
MTTAQEISALVGDVALALLDPTQQANLESGLFAILELQGLLLDALGEHCLLCAVNTAIDASDRALSHAGLLQEDLDKAVAEEKAALDAAASSAVLH